MSEQQHRQPKGDLDPAHAVPSSPLAAAHAARTPEALPTEVLAEGSAVAGAASAYVPAHAAPRPAGSLAATATTAYAHACEIVAIALADLSEYNQAVGSLTQVLPMATASRPAGGRDGWTQAIPHVAPEPFAPDTDGPAPARRRRVPRAVIVLAVLAVLAALGVAGFLALGGPAMFSKVELADVERVLASDEAFMQGFTSTEYVEPAPYELSDVEITQVEEAEDGTVRVDATAVLKNEYFESDCIAVLSFVRASQADGRQEFDHLERPERGDGWIGYVAQATGESRAVAGVSRDPEFGEGFSASFDAAAQTCSYTHEAAQELWFGTRTDATPYTYAFDGRAWSRAAGEQTSSFAFSPAALDGAYGSAEGDAVRMGAFKIVNFDAASGTFSIEYRASTGGLSPQTVSGVIDCALEVAPADDATATYRQADGYVYTFAGDGTSTAGAGSSHIEGYLGLDGSIVFEFAGDYTKPAFLFGDPSNETMTISGVVTRQSA